MFRKVLVPLDGSELAEIALPSAIEMAKAHGAEIILLSAIPQHYGPALADSPEVIEAAAAVAAEEEAAATERSRAYLGRLANKLEAEGLKVSSAVYVGPAAETIIDYAKDNGVELIVMSTHGRSGVQRWLLGSVADRVVHWATVPVLLVRARVP